MSSTSEFMAGSPLALSYPEPFRVTGPLPSLVLRTEDMWQRYNQCLEVVGALNQGFPFSPLMPHFRGLRDGLEYKFLDCIRDHHQLRNRKWRSRMVSPSHPHDAGRAGLGWGVGGCEQMCTLHAVVVLCIVVLVRSGESFHAYTRFIRWGVSTVY